MGSSESKLQVSAPKKSEPAIKNSRVQQLMDPRSPSAGIDRTPIQVGCLVYLLPHIEDVLKWFNHTKCVS